MPKIVALDVGDATIGVAASDELMVTANPVTVIRRTKSVKDDLRAVEELLTQLGATKVVVGLPLNADGEEGPQALKVRDFHERIQRRLRIPVELFDERFSTADAHESLIEMDTSRAKRRKVIDKMAAAVILESYMRETDPGEPS